MGGLSFASRKWPGEAEGRSAGAKAANVSPLCKLSERSVLVRWAGRSEGAAGSLARHSHDGVEARERTRVEEETVASARDARGEDGSVCASSQQPHSDGGRLAQQARGVGAGFVEQAEATSANDSVPTIAVKATRKRLVLGRRVVMA